MGKTARLETSEGVGWGVGGGKMGVLLRHGQGSHALKHNMDWNNILQSIKLY